MKCPQEVSPHYKACYYTLLGSESGSLCALPDNIVYTKQTDGTLHFNVWSLKLGLPRKLSHLCFGTEGGLKPLRSAVWISFYFDDFLSLWACCVLISNINLRHYHNFAVTSPFRCLLLCWDEPAVLLLLVFAGWFSCTQVHPPSCVLTDCPGWKCQNTS